MNDTRLMELRPLAPPREVFELEVGMRPTDELVRIASDACSKGLRVHFLGLASRPFGDLFKVAAAGGWGDGCRAGRHSFIPG
ncbi:MAG: hypothetical protein Q8N23_28710 [Archangium sp.]|nr:hypothetical protein [Archangium sp.]MDP3156688.1 hypothetical protein [Archangium sp.]MDP3570629.1 hypothetical protein [Archangium sp.]